MRCVSSSTVSVCQQASAGSMGKALSGAGMCSSFEVLGPSGVSCLILTLDSKLSGDISLSVFLSSK